MDDKEVEDKTYWSHLGSIGIQAVRVEVCEILNYSKTRFQGRFTCQFFQGEKIRSEKNSVAAGTRSLAFDHYRTFIATSGKSSTLQSFSYSMIVTDQF